MGNEAIDVLFPAPLILKLVEDGELEYPDGVKAKTVWNLSKQPEPESDGGREV